MKKNGYSWEINGDMLKTDRFTLSMNSISSVTSTLTWWGIISGFIGVISIGIFIYSLFLETTQSNIFVIGLAIMSLVFFSSQLIIIADGKKYKVNSRLSFDGGHDIEYLKDSIEEYLKEKI